MALAMGNAVDAALFALVLGGLAVPVLGDVARPLDTAYGVGLLLAAGAGALGVYETVAWLDVVMHLVVTGLVAAVAPWWWPGGPVPSWTRCGRRRRSPR